LRIIDCGLRIEDGRKRTEDGERKDVTRGS
jgi:hypothetical protein